MGRAAEVAGQLPAGWSVSRFPDQWSREVTCGAYPRGVLVVSESGSRFTACYGDPSLGCGTVWVERSFRTLREAVEAVERSFCGCRVAG